VWVTDAPAALTGLSWLYVVAILDVCTRRVVGWAMHEVLDARLAVTALQMALTCACPDLSDTDWA
jgi:transposase InsO family protein